MGHYNSFVVRVWSGGPDRVRGTIEHVATRSRQTFADPSVVLDFIRNHLGPPQSDADDLTGLELISAPESADDKSDP
jgi:hypothetical protein